MRKSIAREYVDLCIALIVSSVLCIAAVLICYSIFVYRNDRRNMMSDAVDRLLPDLEQMLSEQEEPDSEALDRLLAGGVRVPGAEFILFDDEGGILGFSGESPCPYEGKTLSSDVLTGIFNGRNAAISSLDGFFEEARICMAKNIDSPRGICCLLIFMPTDGLFAYLGNMAAVFLCITLFLGFLEYKVISFTVNRTMRPVRDMTIAAKRYGEGDFSPRITIRDQDEMGFLANTLNDMAASLDAIEENRKSFISNVSHELRTPMTTIGGFVDGILDGTIPEKDHKRYLRTVSEEINRLARLVRSMLNISKYEAGEMELQTEEFDITELTVNTVLLFEKRIEDKNIDIVGLDADRIFVNADKDLIQQVIYNLTENAVKFVNKGGYISYGFEVRGDMAAVTVKNSGEGLKKNEMSKVFDRFYKTDASRGKDKTGVGLGLSIVSSIVKLHGGSVLVRSTEGEYTEFEFTIPVGSKKERHM